jgi:hypothetical protein
VGSLDFEVDDARSLDLYFTDATPLGPDYLDSRAKLVTPLVYRDNLPYRRLVSNPSIIVGRKGSGKTSILRSVELDDHYDPEMIIDLPPDDTFAAIVRTINGNVKELLFVEQIAGVWEFLLWNIVIAKLLRRYTPENNSVVTALANYCSALDLPIDGHPYRILQASLQAIQHRPAADGVIDYVRYESHGGMTFPDALAASQLVMRANDRKGILLLDSLEKFQLDIEGMYPAISGFLKSLASFRVPGSPIDVRCCIPSEIYYSLFEISTNPNKDFANSQILHWSSMELLELAAVRFATFLRRRNIALYERLIDHMNFHDRRAIREFWLRFVPPHVISQTGLQEDTLAYIMRHTQLLPRHIIKYANEIFAGKLTTFAKGGILDGRSIVDAISRIESSICGDVIAGRSYRDPGWSGEG